MTENVYEDASVREKSAPIRALAEAVKIASHLNAEGWRACIGSPKFAELCAAAGSSPEAFKTGEATA